MNDTTKYIKLLVEDYYSDTEQMNMILKNARTLQAAAERNKQNRIAFIQSVLGKGTYKKYDNSGLFAPVPLIALKLTFNDFVALDNNFDTPVDKIEKLINKLHSKYYTYHELSYSDNYDEPIRTDIVFKTIDEIINFFYYILNLYSKIFKTEEINWKPIVKKFKNYLG